MKSLIPDSVSKYDNVYDVLKERGFIEQSTDEEKVRELLKNEKVKFYIGVKGSSMEEAEQKYEVHGKAVLDKINKML